MRDDQFRSDAPVRGGGSQNITDFLRDDRGQAATEYILIIGLVCLFIIVAFNRIQDSLKALLSRVVAGLNGPGI